MTRQRIHDRHGCSLAEFPVERIWGEVGPCLALTRGALYDVLRTAAGGLVRYGTAVTAVTDDATVTFGDGTTAAYDLVVGADGIHSAVRRSLFGGPELRFLGQLSWRFVADDTAIPDLTDWTARLGSRGRTFLTVRLGAGRVYCYADINSRLPTAPPGDWRTLFRDFDGPVPRLLEQGADAYFAALHESENTVWTRERAVLVGDAAHACSPSMAQGGAMALEDALVLAETLGTASGPAAALAAFQTRRAGRYRLALEHNHRRDKARNLPTPLRDLTLRGRRAPVQGQPRAPARPAVAGPPGAIRQGRPVSPPPAARSARSPGCASRRCSGGRRRPGRSTARRGG